MSDPLTDRQKEVLKYIIQSFILTATPVGSGYLSKRTKLGLSPATIRNVMADLEEQGYISHPHVSAGRIPTDKGYRLYVSGLIGYDNLSIKEQENIYSGLEGINETEELLTEASILLNRISKQLSIVSSPHLKSGILNSLEIIHISSNRLLIILSIQSGFVKTITMEIAVEIPRSKLEDITRFLNERLSGLSLEAIKETFFDRVKDVQNEDTGLIRLFIGNSDKLFSNASPKERLHISGTKDIISQPEFESPEQMRSVIELIDSEDIIIHLLDQYEEKTDDDGITILIGSENKVEKMQNYSMIISSYSIGDTKGTIGVIGPKRMQYNKVIPLVGYVARVLSTNN
jgi:heat-inducible transcriptional repressor